MIKSHGLIVAGLLLIGWITGCAPSGGGTARDTDPDAQPGSGKASMEWDLSDRRDRSPSQSEIDAARAGPTMPE